MSTFIAICIYVIAGGALVFAALWIGYKAGVRAGYKDAHVHPAAQQASAPTFDRDGVQATVSQEKLHAKVHNVRPSRRRRMDE